MGGTDVLANPQARALSPNTLLDIIFPAPYANLLSLLLLSIVGTYGFYFLLKYLNVSLFVSLFTAVLFAHASWFALHFSEGHIIFASFQLMGLLLLFILKLEQPHYKIYLAVLLSFFLLDGAIYAFLYSIVLLIFSFVFRINGISFFTFLKSCWHQKKHVLFALFLFGGLAGGKLFPLLSMHSDRTPVLENIVLNQSSVLHAFFDPLQHVLKAVQGANFLQQNIAFHEIGAYIGVFALVLIIYFFCKQFQKKFISFLIVMFLFLWIGCGFVEAYNPWRLWQKIPLFNNAHIQTRALFFVYFFTMILLAFALDYFRTLKSRTLFIFLLSFLLIESLFTANYPYYQIFRDTNSLANDKVFHSLIKNSTIDATFSSAGMDWGSDFNHFLRVNKGTIGFMDPSNKHGKIKAVEYGDYKGEVYFLQGKGKVELISYTPGVIHLKMQQDSVCKIQFNTNYLLGWKCNNSDLEVMDEDGLLTFSTSLKKAELRFHYAPAYFYPVLTWYILSLLALTAYFIFLYYSRMTPGNI